MAAPDGGEGRGCGGGPGGFASFDAASFFAQQQQHQEEQRAVQGRQFEALADALLPSSSEEATSSDGGEGRSRKGEGRSKKRGRRASRERKARSTDGEHRQQRNEGGSPKRRRGRRQQRSELEQQVRLEERTGAAQRAPQVKAWASAMAAAEEPYFFDVRGDPANLAFGGLYRLDVAQYHRFDPEGFAAGSAARHRRALYGVRRMTSEADGHTQRERGARYFGPASMRSERSARLRRWRRSSRLPQQWGEPRGEAPRALQLPSPSFLPLHGRNRAPSLAGQRPPGLGMGLQAAHGSGVPAAEELAPDEQARLLLEGETAEDELLRRTREFNMAIRERPHDVQLWLQFAQFQDQALRLGPSQRAGERRAAEKKIAILEKALSLQPDSDELLLALLSAAEAVCEEGELYRRWRAVLARHSGSARLWGAYLRYRRTRFSGFSALEVAASHGDAFAALHREHRRLVTQGAPAGVLASLEAAAAAIALEGCALRFAAGATEQAIAAMLVLLEFNFFSPQGWAEDALEAMFEEFWRSGAPLVGQPGGNGWGAWISGSPAPVTRASSRKQQPHGCQEAGPDASEQPKVTAAEGQEAAGQWSGWEELAPSIRARFGHALQLQSEDVEASTGEEAAGSAAVAADEGEFKEQEEEGEDVLEGAAVAEEADEVLLKKLGLTLQTAVEEALQMPLTPQLLQAWLAMERHRQAAQWSPQRVEAPNAVDKEEAEEFEAASSISWSDARQLLWRFDSQEARELLLVGCVQLLGAPLPAALPSNSSAAAAMSDDTDELWRAATIAAACQLDGNSSPAELCGDWSWLVGPGSIPAAPVTLRQQPWYSSDASRHALLEQLLAALVTGPCSHDPCVAAALLAVASDASSLAGSPTAAGAEARQFAHSRGLAKQLLAGQRSNLALWQAFALLELTAGNSKGARKVFQTCFATLAPPGGLAVAANAAAFVLGAAQLELQLGSSSAGPLSARLPVCGDPAPAYGSGAAGLSPGLVATATDAAVETAARQLAWLGSGAAVPLLGANASQRLAPEEVLAAKRGFQAHLLAIAQQQPGSGQASSHQSGGLTSGGRALVAAAAAFEQLLGRLRGNLAAGVRAALAIYEQVYEAIASRPSAQPRPAHAQLELLGWQLCQLAVDASRLAAVPAAAPGAVRETLRRVMRLFPASPALLQVLVSHEAAGHRLSQLRQELHNVLNMAPSPQAWLALVSVEISAHSPGRAVAGVFERAVSHPSTRSCPLLWRCYLRFEAHRERHEAVRRLFLRAISACPWSKALWCDGLALLAGRVPPKELSEYLEVMKDKGIVVRTDVFEVALEKLEGEHVGAEA